MDKELHQYFSRGFVSLNRAASCVFSVSILALCAHRRALLCYQVLCGFPGGLSRVTKCFPDMHVFIFAII